MCCLSSPDQRHGAPPSMPEATTRLIPRINPSGDDSCAAEQRLWQHHAGTWSQDARIERSCDVQADRRPKRVRLHVCARPARLCVGRGMLLDRLQKTLARMRPRGDASTRKSLWPRTNAFVNVLLGALHDQSQALFTSAFSRTLEPAARPNSCNTVLRERVNIDTRTERPGVMASQHEASAVPLWQIEVCTPRRATPGCSIVMVAAACASAGTLVCALSHKAPMGVGDAETAESRREDAVHARDPCSTRPTD